jgi:hypothetical protein
VQETIARIAAWRRVAIEEVGPAETAARFAPVTLDALAAAAAE